MIWSLAATSNMWNICTTLFNLLRDVALLLPNWSKDNGEGGIGRFRYSQLKEKGHTCFVIIPLSKPQQRFAKVQNRSRGLHWLKMCDSLPLFVITLKQNHSPSLTKDLFKSKLLSPLTVCGQKNVCGEKLEDWICATFMHVPYKDTDSRQSKWRDRCIALYIRKRTS